MSEPRRERDEQLEIPRHADQAMADPRFQSLIAFIKCNTFQFCLPDLDNFDAETLRLWIQGVALRGFIYGFERAADTVTFVIREEGTNDSTICS